MSALCDSQRRPLQRVWPQPFICSIAAGKAAQLVAVDGEIRQLVEVKLNVVQARPASHVLPGAAPVTLEPNDIKELSNESCCPPDSGLAPVEPGDAK